MRRMSAFACSLVVSLGLVLPAPAIAEVFREEYTFTSLWCDSSVSSGRATLYFYGAGMNSSGGPWADIEYVSGRRDYRYSSGEATGFAADNVDGTVTLSISQPLRNSDTGDPAGTAAVSATLAPAGDPYPIDDSYHEPGYGYRESGTAQDLSVVAGTVTIGSTTFTLPTDTCYGMRGSVSIWENVSSAAYVDRGSSRSMYCSLDSQRLGGVYVDAYQESDFTYVDVYVEPRRGFAYGSTTPTTWDDTELSASVTLSDDGGDVGSATIAATFTPATSYTQEIISQGSSSIQEITTFSVSGTIALSLNGRSDTLDLSSCFADSVRFIEKSTSGKQGKGRAPANDAPSGAVSVAPGSSVSVKTGGTIEAPEAPCDGDVGWFGHTVWYRLTGTGSDVTVNTAGSDFDTVAGVYTGDGATLTEVACVDDAELDTGAFTYQSKVTFPTTSGTTYWVQLGGFGGQFGTLNASVT